MGVLDDIKHTDSLTYLKVALAGHITAIKEGIASGNLEMAKEAWDELEDYQKMALWVAYTKGGPFTIQEKEIIRGFDERH